MSENLEKIRPALVALEVGESYPYHGAGDEVALDAVGI